MSEKRAPLISVIVPVYKAEKYLHRCVDSLLAQTFQDYEILLVDDGSPDRSGEICDEYAKKDSRVRVFHKENGGVSSARQCGMDNARGEYTIHADPDDWVEPEMLEELYKKAKEEDADMVICDYYINYRRKQIYKQQKPSSLNHDAIMRQLLLQQLHAACWNKLIRRDLMSIFRISFPLNMTIWEDMFVICNLLMHDVKVAYVPMAFYHYDCYINKNSLIHSTSRKNVLSQVNFINNVNSQLEVSKYEMELRELKCLTKTLAFVSCDFKKDEFISLYRDIDVYYVNRKKLSFASFCTVLSIKGYYEVVKPLYLLRKKLDGVFCLINYVIGLKMFL